ncbi:UNVERIFIED_CONTAM: hypothetical protein HDU68_012384 [Siphonaria sp. JEL0065]|nr:hypothetical protein HDU68_012384 [Siphonaria sp. JEL0065]
MSTIFEILIQTVLVLEVAFYLTTLISPSFLAASQRRQIIKQVRSVVKIKAIQLALTIAFSVTVLMFLESIVSLKPVLQDYHSYKGVSGDGKMHVLLKVHRTEKHLTTSGFVLMMALAIFMRLREKNNYIKLLEKYENLPEGEEHHETVGEIVEIKKTETVVVTESTATTAIVEEVKVTEEVKVADVKPDGQ